MKALLDYQTFTNQIYGGISRYFCALMQAYSEQNLVDFELSTRYSNNYYLYESGLTNVRRFIPWFDFKGKGKIQGFFNQKMTIDRLRKGAFDVFHPTYYNPYFLNYLHNIPFVLTVFDMIHEKYPYEFPLNDKTAERKKILVHKADKIIAISENTKKDILEFYSAIPEEKIEVVYLANSLKPSAYFVTDTKLPDKYIMVVGNRYHYKNCLFMIESIAKLLQDDDSLFLICAGGGGFIEYEVNLFKSLNIQNKVLYYKADNKTLVYLYAKALAFILPSLYEGFGIPVLEAMDCGCPAILSNASSLPEVGGNAAHYFDPTDAASILKAVGDVIYNNEIRNEMIVKGHEQASLFSWEKTAQETVQVYRGII